MPGMTELEALIQRLANDRALLQRGEAATRQGTVNPTLRALGWNTDNLDEVDPEFEDTRGGKVDYCLRYQGTALVLIEVKRAGADLGQHQEQLLNYAFGIGVRLAVLTNGLAWWLYLPMLPDRTFEQRRFARIDFREQDPGDAAPTLNRFLNRDASVKGTTLDEAQREFERQERDQQVRAALPEAWSRALADAQLHELLAREVERIVGHRPDPNTVAAFLSEVSGGRRPVAPPVPSEPATGGGTPQPAGDTDASPPPEPPTAPDPSSFTGRSPAAFRLDGTRYEVTRWRDVLQGVCGLMAAESGVSFGEQVAHLRGRTRLYFSRQPEDLYRAVSIEGSGWFVEGNLSANDCVRFARRVLVAVRSNDDGFRIDLANPEGGTPPPVGQNIDGSQTEPVSFAGRRIAAFGLDGARYEVRSWPHLVQVLSEQLARETGASFAELVASVRGRTRVYFSERPEDLQSARRLADSTLYVEANLGPDRSVRVARLTLQAVRGNDDGFRIELAE